MAETTMKGRLGLLRGHAGSWSRQRHGRQTDHSSLPCPGRERSFGDQRSMLRRVVGIVSCEDAETGGRSQPPVGGWLWALESPQNRHEGGVVNHVSAPRWPAIRSLNISPDYSTHSYRQPQNCELVSPNSADFPATVFHSLQFVDYPSFLIAQVRQFRLKQGRRGSR